MINLLSSATSTPEHAFDTTELIASLRYKLSPELVKTVGALGVERRYSTLANFPDYLRGEPMRATGSATDLGAGAARRCIEEWGGDPRRVGLLIAATNTPAQLLPCLASEVMAKMHGVLSRSISTVSMQAQGCSLAPDSEKVQPSYDVLKRYGNLSSASTGFMLAESEHREGASLVVGFGVGFTASAGVVNFG